MFTRFLSAPTGRGLALAAALATQFFAATAQPAAEAPVARPLTPAQEAAVLRIANGTPTFVSHWRDSAGLQFPAVESIQRQALLARCEALQSRHFSLLKPDHRAAAERVALGEEQERSRILGAPGSATRHRAWLVVFAMLPPGEQASLLAGVEGPRGDQVLQAFSEQRVLTDFISAAANPPSGQPQPAAPVWLKAYFQASDRLPALRAAVGKALPARLRDFDRVDGFDRLTVADAAWLMPLAQDLSDQADALGAALMATYPKDVVDAVKRLQQLEFDAHAESLPSFMPPGSPRSPFAEAADRLYPQPGDPMELSFGRGILLPARAELPKFCAPQR
ncbi:hypothetical protein [Mitsuaria sp. GD03876]|uniref:hypothetical protein n=1 Tax=Mitsuaria sp. GD03876 TaxID=2975399 RepID=UPI00244BC870|nr:hypothetical protein [Mitsuaria sp. GD03876]MDH0862969.1 hypothetical protein [Mitsuaria sp. GD03876]